MTITITQLYKLLSEKTDPQTAEALTNYIEEKVKDEFKAKNEVLATKEDINKLELKITQSKFDMIKWLVTLFITLTLMIIGLYFK